MKGGGGGGKRQDDKPISLSLSSTFVNINEQPIKLKKTSKMEVAPPQILLTLHIMLTLLPLLRRQKCKEVTG